MQFIARIAYYTGLTFKRTAFVIAYIIVAVFELTLIVITLPIAIPVMLIGGIYDWSVDVIKGKDRFKKNNYYCLTEESHVG